MRILMVGTGNVGLMHGWVLSEAGVDVAHVVRPGGVGATEVHLDVMDRRRGDTDCYRAVYAPRVVGNVDPGDGYDLIMVATNHLQATEAVREYAGRLPDADVLMFCANWAGPAAIDALMPRRRYLWGYSVFSGARGDDGVLYANIQPTYRIGAMDGTRPGLLDAVVDTFSAAGIAPDLKDDIIEWLWVHQAVNAGLIGTFLAEGGMPSAGTARALWVSIVRAVRDALAVLSARGVDPGAYPDVQVFLMDDDEEAARLLRDGLLGAPHFERTRAHSHFDANPAEMRRFYWDVVDTGDELGVAMPDLGTLRARIPR